MLWTMMIARTPSCYHLSTSGLMVQRRISQSSKCVGSMQQLVYLELLIRHPATNQTSNGSQKTDLRVLGTPCHLIYWIASNMCAFCIVLFWLDMCPVSLLSSESSIAKHGVHRLIGVFWDLVVSTDYMSAFAFFHDQSYGTRRSYT